MRLSLCTPVRLGPCQGLLSLALLCGTAAAQVPEFETSPPLAAGAVADLVSGAFGAGEIDGRVVAGGPLYKAHFDGGRMSFTPAFGLAAEHNYPLHFTFQSIGRGEQRTDVPSDPQVTRSGNRVSLARGAGLIEHYDATAAGLLQSFSVASRPAGHGDLVLRGRIDTELTFAGTTAEGGLEYGLPGVGGVRFGAVTAIDADGVRQPGQLRGSGSSLELVVPAAFVDGARYPLWIDPEIGTFLTIDGNDWDDGDADVAALSAGDARYLVVWERRFSIGDVDIRGYRLDATGDYAGNFLLLENGDAMSSNPCVAQVRVSGRAFVAWQQNASIFLPPNIVGRAVDSAAGGAVSAAITVAASANVQSFPDVGGERTTADDDVYVVWTEGALGIRGRQVSLPVGNAAPSTVGAVNQISDLVGAPEHHAVCISKTAGDAGIFGLAYEAGDDGVFYRTMTRNGSLTGAQLLLASVGGPHRAPAIDGDGTHFMLVFERGEDFAFANSDLWAGSFTFASGALRPISFEPFEADASDHETVPDVAFSGGQFVVSYLDRDGDIDNTYTKTLDPFTCLICEPESLTSFTAGQDQLPRVATSWSAAVASDEALLLWSSFDGDGDLLAQVYSSPNGQIGLGGACGAGGQSYNPCAYAGNDTFSAHISGAAPLAPAFLLLGFAQSPTPCGPCVLHPSLAGSSLFSAGFTDTYGRASLSLPIPEAASGVTFYTQWGVVVPAATCAAFGIDLSNGLATTVQL